MRKALTALVAVAALAACGEGNGEDSQADAAASETTSATATRTSSPTTARSTAPPATPSQNTLSPEAEASFVATVTAQTIADSGDVLSEQLVKKNSLVEAQTDFRFDEPTRTLVLAVTSTFSTDKYIAEMAYDLAAGFAPAFWGEEVPDTIRPESLVFFSVTVDDASFVCAGPTMAALADRELSQEMFTEQCGA